MAVMDFGKVIKRPGLLRERKKVPATVVLDGYVALFDIDIGRAILAHGSKLDQVAIRLEFTQGKQKVERAHHVVDLRENRMFAVNHGIRRRSLFRKMDRRLRSALFDDGRKKIVVGYVASKTVNGVPGEFMPGFDSFRERTNRGQCLRPELMVPLTARKVVHNGNRMPFA